ncbi:DUF1489 family protein [Sphingomonas piscis]|uniref:DUF1489 family protein n=1 Tax=Sphingomonas piscis TaxID=2714943 RepID=A0A6G7YTD1_9SPHN|nr:DUF1489 family protein [Sphingomonas piscis]
MPTLHLTKVAFACPDLPRLQTRIAGRVEAGEVRVVTRMRPKRAAELIGGSLYWIVKHRMIACQQILRFDDRSDGRIDIVCSPDLMPIIPIARRAHQGWRYYEIDAHAAQDVDVTGLGELPPALFGKLAELALV